LPLLGPPTDLVARAIPGNKVQLTWTNGVPFPGIGVSGTEVWRRTAVTDWAHIADTTATATAFTDRSVQPSTGYTYRVRAYNQIFSSAWSNEVTVSVP